MSCRILKLKRGARFVQNFRLREVGMDWVGVRVRVQLRDGQQLITTFDSAGGDSLTSLTGSVTSPGEYSGQFIAEGPVTRTWPDNLVGDIWVYRASPVWGPYVVLPFEINVTQPSSEAP